MSLTWFILLLSLGLVLNIDSSGGAVPSCKSNWFGFPCRYECHCVNNNCNTNGECYSYSSCQRGWFGPSCQYVDLVATNTASLTPAWVYDYPDTFCNTGQEMVTVSLDGAFFFTWLRLRTNIKVSPQDFLVQLMDANGIAVECGNMYTSSVSDTILDIHCQRGEFFQKLNIAGAGVKWLCSVMISGGRNVALAQNTTQTSVLKDRNVFSYLAVDGDISSDYSHGSCAHTNFNDGRPTWTLTFQRPHHVNRYTLYNRGDLQERLRGFTLEADQEYSRVAFTYTDPTNINHDIYRIPSNNPLIPISSVKITATYNKDSQGIFLTLCEVEMFGDTVCPAGYYGRDCEKRCNCAKSGDSCFVSTGGCPSGCAAGYHWEACQNSCSQKYFGVDCLQKCSTNCTNQLCSSSSGFCFSCIRGTQGPMCEKDCNPKFWGDNCATPCRLDCKNQSCNAVTGTCISCVAGKSGEKCDQACNSTYHGENCALPCSSNCTDQLCNATNGHCQSCSTGKYGLFCDEACAPRRFGKDCKETCSTMCSSQLCEAVTGKCVYCIQGWTGDYCDEACNATYHGRRCALPCSYNCTDKLCNVTNGHCQSCLSGKSGLFCDEACPPRTFGKDCKETCSTKCSSQMCEAVTGKCTSCVQGWTGDYCDDACNGTYGENCALPCSPNCTDQLCNATNGHCQSCLTGKFGLFCDEELPVQGPGSNESLPVALIVGPVVAFVVLVTLIVIGVLIWRRHRHNMDGPEQTNSHRITQDYTELDIVRTVDSNAVTFKKNNIVTGQAHPPAAMKKPASSHGNKGDQVNDDDGDYYNNLQCRSETAK